MKGWRWQKYRYVPGRSNRWRNTAPLSARSPANPPSALSGAPEVTVCSTASRLDQTTSVPTGTSMLDRLNWKVWISTGAGGAATSHPAQRARASHAVRIVRSEFGRSADVRRRGETGSVGKTGTREDGKTESRKTGGRKDESRQRETQPTCVHAISGPAPACVVLPSLCPVSPSSSPSVLLSSRLSVLPSFRPSVLPPTSTDSRHDLPRPCSDHRAHRHHPLLQGVAPGGGASHAHEQSRSRRRRATRGADRLRRGRQGGA